MSHLNTALLNDKEDLHNFLRLLIKYGLLQEDAIMNCDILSFTRKLSKIIVNKENILSDAVILTICSDLNNPDAIKHVHNENEHTINFNLFANGKDARPDFISLVFKFPGKFNFYDFLSTDYNTNFCCTINNFTDSLTNIYIGFKYHESNQMLKQYKMALTQGLNDIEIPIKDMNVDGLKQISEICFVCRDCYITEIEGMFSITNIQVK